MSSRLTCSFWWIAGLGCSIICSCAGALREVRDRASTPPTEFQIACRLRPPQGNAKRLLSARVGLSRLSHCIATPLWFFHIQPHSMAQ